MKKKHILVGVISAFLILGSVLFINVALERIEKMQKYESVEHEILLLNEWLIEHSELTAPTKTPTIIQVGEREYRLKHSEKITYSQESKSYVMAEPWE